MPARLRSPTCPIRLDAVRARALWLDAQRLTETAPFGSGPAATAAAVAHLGYVQIDTINVIERCHHHILFSRIPGYRRSDLHHAQSNDRSVFEYWTHALAYVPTSDYRYFRADMARRKAMPGPWYRNVTAADRRSLLARIRREGALTMLDIDDGVRVEKEHAWASRKPAKRVLQHAFYIGDLTISERHGMLKRYELTSRHFGWQNPPPAAREREIDAYKLERALRAQGVVCLNSICHLEAGRKPVMRRFIDTEVKSGRLVPVALEGAAEHWARPDTLERRVEVEPARVHILSPFDPLIIQRKRLSTFFGYDHLFEAYVPAAKRKVGYFALPVLIGDRIAAAIDLKADRAEGRLLVRKWTWTDQARPRADKALIERALHEFERFQLARDDAVAAARDTRERATTAP